MVGWWFGDGIITSGPFSCILTFILMLESYGVGGGRW